MSSAVHLKFFAGLDEVYGKRKIIFVEEVAVESSTLILVINPSTRSDWESIFLFCDRNIILRVPIYVKMMANIKENCVSL